MRSNKHIYSHNASGYNLSGLVNDARGPSPPESMKSSLHRGSTCLPYRTRTLSRQYLQHAQMFPMSPRKQNYFSRRVESSVSSSPSFRVPSSIPRSTNILILDDGRSFTPSVSTYSSRSSEFGAESSTHSTSTSKRLNFARYKRKNVSRFSNNSATFRIVSRPFQADVEKFLPEPSCSLPLQSSALSSCRTCSLATSDSSTTESRSMDEISSIPLYSGSSSQDDSSSISVITGSSSSSPSYNAFGN